VAAFDEKTQSLLRDLPDEKSAELFLERLANDHPQVHRSLLKNPGLLSDVLALTAWSPLLATTLESAPEYVSWLNRERANPRVRTTDELKESLGRFTLTNSILDPQVLLARFRRRELLRIYLHDIRRTHTVVETTEELSNLADAILDHSLNLARQDLDNKYGPPQYTADRGRVATSEFCIVALGKLGSCELNYSSDIDLLFLYSEDGNTSGKGERGEVTNREYFAKLAAAVAWLVGEPTAAEGAAYRVDLRLRPFGRDGALATSIAEAGRYYSQQAQRWELQALIRARRAAGSIGVQTRFAELVRAKIFRSEVSVAEALASVRTAKQKIDYQEKLKGGGFNVKIGRGGIREIEFIAQALQLAHAGRDPWLRPAHTLITLGRLADRDLISEVERTELSDAYVFLRTVEHRLQMEHGLQTHRVPLDPAHRSLLARRMKFAGDEGLSAFDGILALHTQNVRRAYERVFGDALEISETFEANSAPPPPGAQTHEETALQFATAVTLRHFQAGELDRVRTLIQDSAHRSLNWRRALILTARVAASLDKSDLTPNLTEKNLEAMVRMCGASEFFAEMLAGNPELIASLGEELLERSDFRSVLRASIDREKTFASELSAFRITWSKLLLNIGWRDATRALNLAESNQLQTQLAIASINAAYLIARREMARRLGNPVAGPRLAILGLGRLASGGVDFGSDLDLVFVYDAAVRSPYPSLTQDETYARLGELMISALSSITRTGHLYHVDLRLRPHGSDGPLASGAETLVDYTRNEAAIWEWLAYVKFRAVAGDLDFGRKVELQVRRTIHTAVSGVDDFELKSETNRVRARLQQEQGSARGRGLVDIKYGPGGMLDVYFAVRYLQLRHNVPDIDPDRSTISTLARLRDASCLSGGDYESICSGYTLLRRIDHEQRLMSGRSAQLPALDHPVMQDVAKRLDYKNSETLFDDLDEKMRGIRTSYLRILGDDSK
jgi:[glutamine synthetase] adenylyltransferase / [glutamine synthetase]-adenylyl-L-tyrosine phosphorylase